MINEYENVIIARRENPDEIMHYGVIGMKWGVRRYQNKDGTLTERGKKKYLSNKTAPTTQVSKDDIVIKRGSVQSHVSAQKKIKLSDNELYLYDSKNEHDKKVYEGAYAEYLRIGRHAVKQYVHNYVVTDNLVSPSTRKRVDIFLESYKNNPLAYTEEFNNTVNKMRTAQKYGYNLSGRNKDIAKYRKSFNANTSIKDLKRYGYETLNYLGEYGSTGSKAINEYYNSVKGKGYNAIVDDNNYKVYNNAVLPFITLNANKTLKELNSHRLTNEERKKTIEELRNYNEKKYGHRNIAL